jgi:hypothetical protein
MYTVKDRFLESLCSSPLDARLAAYFASAAAIGMAMTTETEAAIVAHTTPQPFGINGEVNIDFDGDGVAEFQIDHDRYVLSGANIDYLQLDKNDANSPANPLNIKGLATYSSTSNVYEPPFVDDYDGNHHGSWDFGDLAAWESQYGNFMDCGPQKETCASPDGNQDSFVNGQDFLVWQRQYGIEFSYDQGYRAPLNGWYPLALTAGSPINPNDYYDFSETNNAFDMNTYLRANRLIDEDRFATGPNAGKSRIDGSLLGTFAQVEAHPDTPNFVGLGGAVRYLGVRFDLHDEGYSNNLALVNGLNVTDDPNNYWYGWIGIQITNEADATGVVTGWAYEDQRGVGINAGDVGPLTGTTAVPEPGSIIVGAFGGMALLTRFGWRRCFGKSS